MSQFQDTRVRFSNLNTNLLLNELVGSNIGSLNLFELVIL